MLEAAAAAKWNVPVSEVKASNHWVTHAKSGKKLGYGELAADAAKQPVPKADAIKLKDPKDFRYIGKGKTQLIDAFDMTTGKGKYAQDVVMPGMLFAVIARSPVYGGTIKSFNADEARKMPGVVNVVEIKPTDIPSAFQPLAGVAVIADNTWAAINGAQGAGDRVGRRPQRVVLLRHLSRRHGSVGREAGQGDPHARRRGQGHGDGGQDGQGRLLRAAPRAGADGAAGRDRAS